MKISTIISILSGILLGYSLSFLTGPPLASSNSEENNAQLISELAISKDRESKLKEQLTALQLTIRTTQELKDSEISKSSNAITESEITNVLLPAHSLYNKAMLALENNDKNQAKDFLNQLLLVADNEVEREQAKDALMDIYKADYEDFISQENMLPAALWSLFEMHKLRPNSDLKDSIISLSSQTYTQAQDYLAEGNLLDSANNLFSLINLSRMVNYEVETDKGDILRNSELQSELNHIESNPEYLNSLKTRAENSLYNGDELKRLTAFWDYSKLVTLSGPQILKDIDFRDKLTLATLENLNYLKRNNKDNEIRMRLDHIRYSFPILMENPQISDFH